MKAFRPKRLGHQGGSRKWIAQRQQQREFLQSILKDDGLAASVLRTPDDTKGPDRAREEGKRLR